MERGAQREIWEGLTVLSLLCCPNFQKEKANPGSQENISHMAHLAADSARCSEDPAVLSQGRRVHRRRKVMCKNYVMGVDNGSPLCRPHLLC